jgi:hypothetical protein
MKWLKLWQRHESTSLLENCKACSADGFNEQLRWVSTGRRITTNDCHSFLKGSNWEKDREGVVTFWTHSGVIGTHW